LISFVRFLWTFRRGCFNLNWMSGSQPTESAVDQILKQVDLASVDLVSIHDERARECIHLLLNLVESLAAQGRKLQAENLALREQLRGRKGGGGKPDPPKDAAAAAARKKSVPSLREKSAPNAASSTAFGSTGK